MIFLIAALFLFALFIACGEAYHEKDFPRRTAKFVAIFAVLLLFAFPIFGQTASYYSSSITTIAKNAPSGAQVPVYTIPFAKIQVCSYPATPVGSLCTNTVSVYSDQALTMPITQPFSADSQGNFGFWAAPLTYAYSVQTPSGTYSGTYIISAGPAGQVGPVGPASPAQKQATSAYSNGDSISVGFNTANPGTQNYPYIVTNPLSLGLVNRGIVGDQACDIATRQIFPNGDGPSLAYLPYYLLMIGTNDVDAKGAGAYEAVFNACHQAAIAWNALPVEFKVLGSAATRTGSASVETMWNACTTNAANDTCTFTISRVTPGPVYIWQRLIDGSAGVGTYQLDSLTPVGINTATTPAIATQNGSNNSMGLIRLTSVAAGVHIITLKQTSSSGTLGFVAVGAPPSPSIYTLPEVAVGVMPFQGHGINGYATQAVCGTNDAACAQYNADITANVALLASDGLDIRLVNTRAYLTQATLNSTYYNDDLHPILAGQNLIARAFSTTLMPSLNIPSYPSIANYSAGNVFDARATTPNVIVSTVDGTLLSPYTGYTTTDYIDLGGASSFTANFSIGMFTTTGVFSGIAFYDVNKTFVSGIQNGNVNIAANSPVAVPTGVRYVRFWTSTVYLSGTSMVYRGSVVPATFSAFPNPKTPAATPNIFDYTAVTSGSIVSSTDGTLISGFSGFFSTDYMDLRGASCFTSTFNAGMYISGSTHAGVAFYDVNKTFLSGIQKPSTNDIIFGICITAPASARYVRIWQSNAIAGTLSQQMVVTGSVLPQSYIPYGLLIGITPAATGTRYLCIDTQGHIASSATACSGT